DLAEAFALLLDRPERLCGFERLQFEGLFDESGTELIDAIRQICRRDIPVRSFPWWAIRLAAPFNGFMREAAEIAPYWGHPMRL
ncbi:NAD-dependent epimerase, partial [Escherichia coli]|nr:NAD-dependent epimerase [Escherichia coli]